MAHTWAGWLHNPCRLEGPQRFKTGDKDRGHHKWAGWLHNACRMEGPQHFKAGDKIKHGPQMGGLAT